MRSRPILTFAFVFLMVGLALAQQQPLPVSNAVDKGHAVGREQEGVNAVMAALRDGGNVNERDPSGWTPLMHAALECRPKIVRVLLDHGAEVNLRGSVEGDKFSNSGQTALLLAAGCFIARRRGQLASERGLPAEYVRYELAAPATMVSDLLAHHADVSMTDVEGRTALMLATMHGWAEVVRELLRAHAAINARDREGRLAIDYADLRDQAMLALLKNAGSLPATGHSGRIVCDAERQLRQLGFDQPIEDCIRGPQFSMTVKEFQKSHGLKSTGILDLSTLQALGVRR